MKNWQIDYGTNVANPRTYATLARYCVNCKRRGYVLPLARYRKALLEGYAPDWMDGF